MKHNPETIKIELTRQQWDQHRQSIESAIENTKDLIDIHHSTNGVKSKRDRVYLDILSNDKYRLDLILEDMPEPMF